MGWAGSKVANSVEEGKLLYGGRGHASAMQRAQLDDGLTELLCAPFLVEEERMTQCGFQRCVDYPQLPGHVYYEGYFHGRVSGSAIASLNPRNGRLFNKPPAPAAFRAFLVVFRKVNADALAEIGRRIYESASEADHDKALELSMLLAGDDVCADVAVQVHCGDGVHGEDLGWHYDSINSALHMAVSLHGTRTLHVKLSAERDPKNVDRTKNGAALPLSAGDVYISSPYTFMHSVEYPASRWADRTIAAQCRFLLAEESSEALRHMSDAMRTALTGMIAEAIANGVLVLPTRAQVEAEMQTLAPYKGSYDCAENYLDGNGVEDEMAVYHNQAEKQEESDPQAVRVEVD